ncbi:hypothetical protein BJX61DRAFT_212561 [Aspergillus egyptiacus]|nr:hypothetical protein BJX61DRAFT_212561 [Aspergillus egyptiacus]
MGPIPISIQLFTLRLNSLWCSRHRSKHTNQAKEQPLRTENPGAASDHPTPSLSIPPKPKLPNVAVGNPKPNPGSDPRPLAPGRLILFATHDSLLPAPTPGDVAFSPTQPPRSPYRPGVGWWDSRPGKPMARCQSTPNMWLGLWLAGKLRPMGWVKGSCRNSEIPDQLPGPPHGAFFYLFSCFTLRREIQTFPSSPFPSLSLSLSSALTPVF